MFIQQTFFVDVTEEVMGTIQAAERAKLLMTAEDVSLEHTTPWTATTALKMQLQ